MDVKFMIAVTDAEHAAKRENGLIAKVVMAMKETYNHWLLTDDDERFKAAVAGAIMACDNENDREHLKDEMKSLNSLSALLTGVPVDFSKVKTPKNPIGLMNLWLEIKGENKR